MGKAETFYENTMLPEIKKFQEEIFSKVDTAPENIKQLYFGWKVWFSPIIDEPEVLFIGINPGGGEGGEVTLGTDGILQYCYDESKKSGLIYDTKNIFKELEDKVDLSNCIKTNYYYIATKDVSKKYFNNLIDFLGREKDKSGLGDRFYENSKKWTQQILNIIKPKLIICEGKQAFDLVTKYALELRPEIDGKEVFSTYCNTLGINILGYKRKRGRGGILSPTLLKEKILELI